MNGNSFQAMRTLALVGMLAAVLLGGTVGCSSRAIIQEALPEIAAVTYNIRAARGLPNAEPKRSPEETAAEIGELLAASGADLVFLQEVDINVPRSGSLDLAGMLGEQLGFHHVFGEAIPLGQGQYGVAILSRWPIRSSKTVKLFRPDPESLGDLPDYYAEQRVALVAEVNAPFGDFTAISTHLGLTAGQRLKQVDGLIDLARASQNPLILGGDLNAAPDSEEIANMRAVLADATGLTDTVYLTFPADEPNRAIDYVFYSPQDFAHASTEVLNTQLSDHRPLMTRLLWIVEAR